MTLFTDSIFLTNELEGFKECRETRSASSMSVILCKTGYIDVVLNGQSIHVGANDLFVRIPHKGTILGPYSYSPDYTFIQLTIDSSIFEQLMLDHMRIEPRWWQKQQFMIANPVFHLNDVSIDFCNSYFHMLTLQLGDKPSPNRKQIIMTIARAATMEMFNYLDKMVIHSADDRLSVDRSDYIFRQFTHLMHENPYEREVQWFAAQLHITPKYLSEICRARSSKSASEWIAETTVSNIKYYLKNSTMPVRYVAEMMKFPNASFFCQYTKKHTGLTPNQIRRQKTQM